VRAKKERKRKEKAAGKEAGPAESAASATHRMLASRKLSSKVNYTVLAQLFKSGAGGDAKGVKRKQEPVEAKQASPWVQPGLAKKGKVDQSRSRRVTFAEDGESQQQGAQPKVGKSRLGRAAKPVAKARTVASVRAAEREKGGQREPERQPERGEDMEETARMEMQQMEDLVPETTGYGDDDEYYHY
jgi:hypothetical protein